MNQQALNLRKPLLTFFLLAFIISWSIWGIGFLFPPELGFAFFPLGVWGPALAAVTLSFKERRVKALLLSIKPHRIPRAWLVLMLIAAPLAMSLPLLYFLLMGEAVPLSFILEMLPAGFQPWYVIPLLPVLFPLLMLGNLGEEIGWRGFATQRLGRQYGFLLGAVILGVLNAVWHIPLYWLIGNPIYNPFSLMFLGFVIFEVGYTIFITTMWLKNRKSIYTGLVVHTSVTVGSLLLPTWAYLVPIMVSGILMLVIALVVYYRAEN
jgi:CAAX protease family protein